MEFNKGRIEKEKNIIIITPVGNEKSYRLDVNTGVLYGLRGLPMVTIPSVLNEGMKIANLNRYNQENQEDKTAVLLSNLYDVLSYSDLNLIDLISQTGVLLILDKIINAVGTFYLDYISIGQLQYIDEHFTTYVKYMKDETIFQGLDDSSKTFRFKEWHTESLLNEKFNISECSECTKQVVKKLTKDFSRLFSDKDIKLVIGFCEHQLATFFNDDQYKISEKLIEYKRICDDLQVPMKKGNFMIEFNAVKREYELRKADIDKAKLQAKYAQHSKAWEFEDDDYMLIVPTCVDDFIQEGKLQHNCVGGYVNTVKNSNNGRYVIFLRKKEDPKNPLLTVEINSYSQTPNITQFLLAYNQSPNPDTQPELLDLKDRLFKWIRENW